MKTLILAAGKGTRLRPITDFIPKPMAPVHGKPLLEWVILHLQAFGLADFVIAVSYFAEQIQNYFGDGSRWGVDIRYSYGASPAGKAGEIWRARDYLGGENCFLVVPGDTISQLVYRDFLGFHKDHGGLVSVAFSTRYRLEVGFADVDAGNNVTRFYEKTNFDRPVSTGAYILDRRIMPFIERFGPERQTVDLPEDVFPVLQQERIPIYGFVRDFAWWDIGKISEYDEVVKRPVGEMFYQLGYQGADHHMAEGLANRRH